MASLGVAIAIIGGARPEEAAVAVGWGALLMGGFMAMVFVALLAIALATKRRAPAPGELGAFPGPAASLGAYLTFRWRQDAVMIAVLVGAATVVDPRYSAFLSGYLLGMVLISVPAFYIAVMAAARWIGDDREESPRLD